MSNLIIKAQKNNNLNENNHEFKLFNKILKDKRGTRKEKNKQSKRRK